MKCYTMVVMKELIVFALRVSKGFKKNNLIFIYDLIVLIHYTKSSL